VLPALGASHARAALKRAHLRLQPGRLVGVSVHVGAQTVSGVVTRAVSNAVWPCLPGFNVCMGLHALRTSHARTALRRAHARLSRVARSRPARRSDAVATDVDVIFAVVVVAVDGFLLSIVPSELRTTHARTTYARVDWW
jgi:ribosomal protein L32